MHRTSLPTQCKDCETAYLLTCLRSHTLTLHPVPAHPPSGSPPSACTPALAPQMTCQRCSCAASSGVQCAKVQWQNIIAGNGLIQGISRVVSTTAAGVLCALAVPPSTMETLGDTLWGYKESGSASPLLPVCSGSCCLRLLAQLHTPYAVANFMEIWLANPAPRLSPPSLSPALPAARLHERDVRQHDHRHQPRQRAGQLQAPGRTPGQRQPISTIRSWWRRGPHQPPGSACNPNTACRWCCLRCWCLASSRRQSFHP